MDEVRPSSILDQVFIYSLVRVSGKVYLMDLFHFLSFSHQSNFHFGSSLGYMGQQFLSLVKFGSQEKSTYGSGLDFEISFH